MTLQRRGADTQPGSAPPHTGHSTYNSLPLLGGFELLPAPPLPPLLSCPPLLALCRPQAAHTPNFAPCLETTAVHAGDSRMQRLEALYSNQRQAPLGAREAPSLGSAGEGEWQVPAPPPNSPLEFTLNLTAPTGPTHGNLS